MRVDWETIDEFPDYAVSNEGEIANMKSGMPRRTSINQQGIVKISLYKGRELITRSVAVLVADAFVEGKSEFFDTPIHLDGDKTNCAASNLMWRPRWFAIRYHKQFFVEAFHRADVRIMDLDSGREFDSVKDACTTYGLYHNDVYRSFTHEIAVPLTLQEFRLLDS